MKHITTVILLILILFSFNCKQSDVTVPEENTPAADGIETLYTAGNVKFFVKLPEGYSPTTSVPLVFALHYGGTPTPDYAKQFINSLIFPGFQNLGAIIVAPNCPTPGSWATSISDTGINAVLDYMFNNYNIDQSKVLITGYSMGGIGTWHYAAKYPDIFKLAIPIAGMISSIIGDTLSNNPIYVIHGDQDQTFPLAPLQIVIDELLDKGFNIELVIGAGLTHNNVSQYIALINEAIPWIQANW